MANNIYFLYGEESFLVEEKLNEIIKQNTDKEKSLFSEQFNLSLLFDTISTLSLFSTNKLLLLRNPFFLYETLSDSQVALFFELCDMVKNSQHIMVIYSLNKNIDSRKKINNFLKKNTTALEFSSFKGWEQDKVFAWVKNRLTSLNKTIEEPALMALEMICGPNLRQLSLEIDKLIVYLGAKNHITLADIKATISGNAVTGFDFIDALKDKKTPQLIEIARQMCADGDDPIKILGLLTSTLRLYYQICVLSQTGLSAGQMAQKVGKNPYYLERLKPAVTKHYTVKSLQQGFNILNQTDLAIKSGKLKPEKALLLALTKI